MLHQVERQGGVGDDDRQTGQLVGDRPCAEQTQIALFAVLGFAVSIISRPVASSLPSISSSSALPHGRACGTVPMKPNLLDRPLRGPPRRSLAAARSRPCASIPVCCGRAGSVLHAVAASRPASISGATLHVTVGHRSSAGCNRSISRADAWSRVEPAAVVIANRGLLQFVRQAVDDHEATCVGAAVLPECFVDDDQAESLPSAVGTWNRISCAANTTSALPSQPSGADNGNRIERAARPSCSCRRSPRRWRRSLSRP